MIAQEEGTVMGAALRQTPPVTTYPILGLCCKTYLPVQYPVLFYAMEINGEPYNSIGGKVQTMFGKIQNSGQRKTPPLS